MPPAIGSNADRAAAYGIPGERVEDNDVDAVYTAAGGAVALARAGEEPSLIEVSGEVHAPASGHIRPLVAEKQTARQVIALVD